MAVAESPRGDAGASRRRLLYDPKFRSLVIQAAVLIAVVAVSVWIISNTVDNLRRSNIASGFGFFGFNAGFDVSQTFISFDSDDTVGRAFVVGVINTLVVAILGIALATVLGIVVGIARLSRNWLLARLGTVYVETLRNIPPLLFLLFWYRAVLSVLPGPRQGFELPFSINLSNRGLMLPEPVFGPLFWIIAVTLLVSTVVAIVVGRWAVRRRIAAGEEFPTFWVVLAILVVPAALVFVATGRPLSFDFPVLEGFNFRGGLNMQPELVALTLGLSLYTSTFIAEVVRAGILSVSHGQTEAARALGLSSGKTMRLVIFPQAFRVIIPPLTNQYLNLTKNSTLAVAIGYPDFFAVFVGSVYQRTGQAVEIIVIAMGFYLVVSLLTAVFMNWFNRKMAIPEH